MQDRRSRRSRRARFAGCGGTTRPHTGHQSAGNPGPFAWLRPAATPADREDRPAPVAKGATGLPAAMAGDTDRPGHVFRGAAGTARLHPRLPQRNAPVRRRDTRQLGRCRPANNHEEGDRDSFATPRRSAAIPLGHRLVRDRPLRQHLRALQGDRLHRARDTGHHDRRRRGPASGLDTPGTQLQRAAAELLELMQPGTSDTPAPCVTSGRLDWRGVHARWGRDTGVRQRAIGSRVASASVREGRTTSWRRCSRPRSASYDDSVTLQTSSVWWACWADPGRGLATARARAGVGVGAHDTRR